MYSAVAPNAPGAGGTPHQHHNGGARADDTAAGDRARAGPAKPARPDDAGGENAQQGEGAGPLHI